MMKDDFDSGNKNAKPDVRTSNILIKSCLKSGKKNSINKAEMILKEMIDLYECGYLDEGPNKITYRTMIRCLQNAGGTKDRIEELKKLLESSK